jgi:hypothetical protein
MEAERLPVAGVVDRRHEVGALVLLRWAGDCGPYMVTGRDGRDYILAPLEADGEEFLCATKHIAMVLK